MISENDLLDAIDEVERMPDSYGKCQKLATFYSLLTFLYPQEDRGISQAAAIPETVIGGYGDSEFLQAVSGRSSGEVWSLMDELMLTVGVLHPRLYAGVMRRLNGD